MDLITVVGIIIGVGGILLGQVMEGGHIGSLVQSTAAFIVFGGTLGAVLVSNTREDLRSAMSLLKLAFFGSPVDPEPVINEIVEAAQIARKESILALEKRIPAFRDDFMKSVFRFVIDGIEPSTLKDIFENEIAVQEERLIGGARVFSDAGGFSPTIGIIGAVLGLIHVMESLTDTVKLGTGIAVAFVATVYGVGAANLIFLPLGNKLKRKVKEQSRMKEMILMGALSIVAGQNPLIIREKMTIYANESDKVKKEGGS